MIKQELLNAVAPCSLFCHTCFGYKNGAVKNTAKEMFLLYKGWYEGYVMAYGDNPSEEQAKNLEAIKSFNKTLNDLQENAHCPGCREANGDFWGCIKSCIVPKCTKEHGVDYCAECTEFPCDKNNNIFDENTLKGWIDGCNYIKQHGVEDYFEKNKLKGHYSSFCRDCEE